MKRVRNFLLLFCWILLVGCTSCDQQTKTVTSLIEKLDDKDAEVRRFTAYFIGTIGPDATPAIPALRKALSDSDPEVRVWAAEAIWRINPQDTKAPIRALTDALDSNDSLARRKAVSVLGEIGSEAKQAIPLLMKWLQHKNAYEQILAASAISQIDPQKRKVTVPILIHALADDDQFNRRVAAQALGKIGPTAKQAIPALRALLNDENEYVKKTAKLAIDSIKRQ